MVQRLLVVVCLVTVALGCATHAQRPAGEVMIWHAYRGSEKDALEQVVEVIQASDPTLHIRLLALPFDAYASKLESAIPRGHGPDLFIDAHERLGGYLERGLVMPVDDLALDPARNFEPAVLDALRSGDRLYGLPLAVKCLALYVNTTLVTTMPTTLEQIEALRPRLASDQYPLAYSAADSYFHAALAHAYGSGLLDGATGQYRFVGPAAIASVERVRAMLAARTIPDEADAALVSRMFAHGRAATVISGPWLAAELASTMSYRVVPLPRVASAGGTAMVPYSTIEAVYLSARVTDHDAAARVLRSLAGIHGARVRAVVGRQVVAHRGAWSDPMLATDSFLSAFREAARRAVPMPTHRAMRVAFESASRALRRAFRGDAHVSAALLQGQRRFSDATRSEPPRRSPTLALLALGVLALALSVRGVQRARDPLVRLALRRSWPAWRWVLHAAVVLFALVVAPLFVGAVMSLYAGREGSEHYVGLAHYVDILSARGGALLATGSFYRVLAVTILWTLANVALHVGLGVALALLLARPLLRLRGVYRVLLIVPWAVPSYVTALAWKGMFHRQFGAINALLGHVGVDPIAWFSRFATAFAANLATNAWLGFPFMMVVTLGALAAIPKDVYEAAAVDGATPWQQFTRITVPLLGPSLAPAVVMGAVWTFNQFNVIFLVSGGEPDGETDTLITEAYRWAFTRQAQYGYAAAYAVLIFGILVTSTNALGRLAERVRQRGVT